jgi:Ca-activated chloride channel family protein
VALARGARGDDRFGLRGEFVQLVELAQSLQTPAATLGQRPNAADDSRLE